MLNHGKTDEGTKINVLGSKCHIFIWPESIYSGGISVRESKDGGKCLWQKFGCTSDDIPFAIEIAKRGIDTGIFETSL